MSGRRNIDPRFLDPSGWTPYDLQLSVPPEQAGLSPEDWLRRWHGFKPLKKRPAVVTIARELSESAR